MTGFWKPAGSVLYMIRPGNPWESRPDFGLGMGSDSGRFRNYSQPRLSPNRPAGPTLTSGDGAARSHLLRKGPAALGATFVNPAGEGGRVQHGASFARVVGKPNPTATFRGRPDQGFHSQLFSFGLEDLSLRLAQAENPGPTAALGAALVHAYLAGRSRTQAGSKVRCHYPSPLHRADLARILSEILSVLNRVSVVSP